MGCCPNLYRWASYIVWPRGQFFAGRDNVHRSAQRQRVAAFLLLDEPTEGLAAVLVKSLGERIQKLKAVGLTVLLAEQNV
jgi:ABC-type lipopolysaccharide export system ATPase subunit